MCGHKEITEDEFAVTKVDTGLHFYKGQRALHQTEGKANERKCKKKKKSQKLYSFKRFVIKKIDSGRRSIAKTSCLTLWRLTTYIYICCTAQLISRRRILNIYSTNILTEYFKHAAHSPFFSLFKMPFIS